MTKPGIIRGNILTAAAGFFLASQGHINQTIGLGLGVGLSLVIASGCVANNYIDRGIDAKMKRTQNRALVSKTISARSAILFAVILLVIGIIVLLAWTNMLATILSLLGFVAYVVLYGYAKRRSRYGTLVGSISGALPPVIGYTAVLPQLDSATAILFLILVCWQMPHFYAIALYRSDDYKTAGIPVLPLIKGFQITKRQILIYIGLYIVATTSLMMAGYAGLLYVIPTVGIAIIWLVVGIMNLQSSDSVSWSKQMFRLSLLVILVFCVAVSFDAAL